MPQVSVTIAGRLYRMACGEGEEEHIEQLAASLDRRIEEMRTAFGEIGDMRLHVMAALTIADELSEAKRGLERLEGEVAALKEAVGAGDERLGDVEERLAGALSVLAERIERVTKTLTPSAQQSQS
ncbi:cell division protein ZapA [Chelatococcus composti]|uniref:Cell division protein ZapA n=1 Tax=Chelatococcus composti TaxID=1743235 RepID=A0A841KF66_9HYPH|nr:cell division protein ZapA [Chelatococcus composti]MBB6167899.1 cell division protein ZapA [Chelatococcus composti]MBS7734906.1 cell division protein ZapA [Chelatococcus composti]PZN38097.1 MAG: cell division protein ZapA [Pseudomonadota bacterium]GGG35075.1 cell division protein ZapA [Chelatococcus composti]